MFNNLMDCLPTKASWNLVSKPWRLFQVISALRDAGLESSNLILGIDFTKSNEWTGRCSLYFFIQDKPPVS